MANKLFQLYKKCALQLRCRNFTIIVYGFKACTILSLGLWSLLCQLSIPAQSSLDSVAQSLTWIPDRNEGYPELELVLWPVLQQRLSLGQLRFHVEVGEEHQHRVGGYKNEYVPKAVQVWKIDRGPGLAEDPVIDPAEHRNCPDGRRSDAQAVDPLVTNSV